jgi:hypothetical protein
MFLKGLFVAFLAAQAHANSLQRLNIIDDPNTSRNLQDTVRHFFCSVQARFRALLTALGDMGREITANKRGACYDLQWRIPSFPVSTRQYSSRLVTTNSPLLTSLPVPSLWLDVFQKIKALGMNTVSFYLDWALLEGKQGFVSAEGPLALEPLFDAAKQAGVYLIARPGPYINAEAAGGGFPGWLQRVNATLRTTDADYMNATKK